MTGREWERSTEKETESGHCSLLRRFRILFKTWETERERETKREKEREREREREGERERKRERERETYTEQPETIRTMQQACTHVKHANNRARECLLSAAAGA